MAQQVAAREQLDQLSGVTLPTALNEFAKARWVADSGAFLLEIAGETAVDDRADGEAAADERPGGADAEALMVKLDCPIEGELDRQRADQSARGKRENATEQAFGDRDLAPPRSSPRTWLRARGAQREQFQASLSPS